MSDPGKIIVALDFADEGAMWNVVERLDPHLCRLKIGKEFFTATGPRLIRRLMDLKFEIFLDLKFHDIPHTVGAACKAAADLGVWMIDVHALGGRKMLEAASQSLQHLRETPWLTAVTVLTSMDVTQLAELGLPAPEVLVPRLAKLAQDCGLYGVVCSAQEASQLKALCGPGFKLVTPGIRLENNVADDQKRIMTPAAAIAAGADYLVIGRPITQSTDPRQTLIDISQNI